MGESNILGNYVTVNHEGGFSTLYAHCSAITASAGQSVKKGDAIAKVGSTGNATGSHLHFEVHDGEEYLNPVYCGSLNAGSTFHGASGCSFCSRSS